MSLFSSLSGWFAFWLHCYHVIKENIYYQMQAVFYGNQLNKSGSLFNVRRKTHFLEKILAYYASDLSKSHARLFVGDLVREYKIVAERDRNVDDLSWSTAVLTKFFASCPKDKVYMDARDVFRSVNFPNKTPDLLPYPERSRPVLPFSYEEFHQMCIRRRSIRQFLPTRVPVALVEKAMECALLSPTCCNRQAFRYFLFTELADVQTVQMLTAGGKKIVLPAIILLVGDYSAYHNATELFCPIIDSMQSVMAFQFALETLGLGSVCINWATNTEADTKLRSILTLKKEEIVTMTLGLGFPDPNGMIPCSAKRPVSQCLVADPALRKSK